MEVRSCSHPFQSILLDFQPEHPYLFRETHEGGRTEGNGMRPVRRIAVLGGGTGISAALCGLARVATGDRRLDIVAVVATADDGGSSGRLRRERGGIPPGDLRTCLLALAGGSETPLSRLLSHRYNGTGALAGHSLGNLILAAVAEEEGSYLRAAQLVGEMLGARGRVLPVSVEGIRLEAEVADGSRISGESLIGRSPSAIRRVWLEPADPAPAPGVVDAIRSADLVVLGPGSLFTSLLAVVLVPGVRDAVRACRGHRVLVANLMTQPAETLGMDLCDHMEALDGHVGPGLFQTILAHGPALSPSRVRPYDEQGSRPVVAEYRSSRPERLVTGDLVTRSGMIRHDADALAFRLLDLLDFVAPRTGATGGTVSSGA